MSFVLLHCANPVSPTGGPQDKTPPKMVEAEPPLFTKNFKDKKIKVFFNEYVELKDIGNQLIVSPPMQKNPEIKIKGKSVVIEFEEELLPETTYNFFFGDAIVDITEGNPYSNFQYIFSTGDILDSLSIKGNIYNAFDNAPPETTNVMLYLDNNDTVVFDSVPYVLKPYFMTKTDGNGNFTLNNLPDKNFKLFALLDVNGNLIYDQPNELIAFSDKLVAPYFIKPILPDSLQINDTISPDSSNINIDAKIEPTEASLQITNYKLSLFQEIDSVQRLMKAVVAKEHQINFIFKIPTNNAIIRVLNLEPDADWSLSEINYTRDTLVYWLKNVDQDSLKFEISDNHEILDTVFMSVKKRTIGRKEKKESEGPKPLRILPGIKGKKCDLHKPIYFRFGYPVERYDFSEVQLFEHDTIPVIPEFLFSDSIKRKLQINYKWVESANYTLIFLDSIFYDIHRQSNDSLIVKFSAKSLENYGNLYFNVTLLEPGSNHIIQLMRQDKVIKEKALIQNGQISFEFLDPGEYQVKVIYDRNNNEIWDTGDYIYNIQPEKVDFFPTTLTIRGNWDMEEDWEL